MTDTSQESADVLDKIAQDTLNDLLSDAFFHRVIESRSLMYIEMVTDVLIDAVNVVLNTYEGLTLNTDQAMRLEKAKLIGTARLLDEKWLAAYEVVHHEKTEELRKWLVGKKVREHANRA